MHALFQRAGSKGEFVGTAGARGMGITKTTTLSTMLSCSATVTID